MQVIVQAEFWRQQMIENPTKSLAEIMKPYKVKPNYVRRLINAAYLAPPWTGKLRKRTWDSFNKLGALKNWEISSQYSWIS